jgi:MFS family permease
MQPVRSEAQGPEAVPSSFFARGPALFALAVLFGMNLLNYVDRYVFFSVKELVAHDLHLDDTRLGWLDVSFMIVYTLASPLVGWMGDRYHRRRLMAFGVALWSVATVGSSYSTNFSHLFFWRSLLGIGEASYGILAPTLLADLFPQKWRGRAMGIYFMALPLGGAIGYGIGGWVGEHYGWRHAFWLVGLPGLAASLAALMIHDPGRGGTSGGKKPGWAEYLSILKTRSFVYNTAGLAAVTFATGAFAAWGAVFYQRVRGMSPGETGIIGVLMGLGGAVGIGLGSWGADRLQRRMRRAYMLWGGGAVALALPLSLGAIMDPGRSASLTLLFLASVVMSSVLGPCNTVTANVVPADRRAAGYAISIFLMHLFGDISSPLLIGYLSDLFGRPSIAGSGLGVWLASVGAGPVPSPAGPTNLVVGMLTLVPMLALGSIFFSIGSRYLPGDQERARLAGGEDPGPVYAH